jgi:hypothetical protein
MGPEAIVTNVAVQLDRGPQACEGLSWIPDGACHQEFDLTGTDPVVELGGVDGS